ncbi:NAD(P)-dependent oxidoreductase [Nocardia sp. CA-119907]|uniref:NAD(P)-dependent oxidoreductase n=1 Tax=Nocardia sp. CA-119907 TaxID=3239973 RepID=UPI003D973F04
MGDSNTVAVLGAGIMANAVANTLHAHGFELRRYNRTTVAIDGPAIVCASPAQAAEGAAAVWSFVHDDTASRAVWFGQDGALETADGAIVIESSTLSPQYADQWMREATGSGARAVLAPVTGSRPGVVNRTLLAFVTGTTADLAVADPLLRVVTRDVVRVESAAATAEFKLLNNALAATILTALAETLTAATTLGLNRHQLIDVWAEHGWAAPVASAYGEAMLSGEHPLTNCALAVLAKDVHYTLAALGDQVPPVLAAVADRFDAAMAGGLGSQEMSAIIDAAAGPP